MQRAGNDHVHGGYVLATSISITTPRRARITNRSRSSSTSPVGTSSFRLRHEVRLPDGTLAASGETVVVAWDPTTRGKRALTEEEVSAIS